MPHVKLIDFQPGLVEVQRSYTYEVMAVAQTGKKNTEAFSNHWLHLDISESELTLRQRFQRKSSFNADGVKWRQSWSSCELKEEDEEKNQEGEKDSNGSGKKMYLKKLKKKSMKVF